MSIANFLLDNVDVILPIIGVGVSEALPFVTKIKSNGIAHLIYKVLERVFKPKK